MEMNAIIYHFIGSFINFRLFEQGKYNEHIYLEGTLLLVIEQNGNENW